MLCYLCELVTLYDITGTICLVDTILQVFVDFLSLHVTNNNKACIMAIEYTMGCCSCSAYCVNPLADISAPNEGHICISAQALVVPWRTRMRDMGCLIPRWKQITRSCSAIPSRTVSWEPAARPPTLHRLPSLNR